MTEEALLVQLQGINDRVTELCAALNERCPDHSRRLLGIEQTIDGPATNGNTPGLKARMLVVEKTTTAIEKDTSDAMAAIRTEYIKTSAAMRKMTYGVILGPTGIMGVFGAVVYFLIRR